MSGYSFTKVCPKCSGIMYAYSGWKPHNLCTGQCLDCGYHYWTETGRMSIGEINELRAEQELKPLKKRRSWR